VVPSADPVRAIADRTRRRPEQRAAPPVGSALLARPAHDRQRSSTYGSANCTPREPCITTAVEESASRSLAARRFSSRAPAAQARGLKTDQQREQQRDPRPGALADTEAREP